MIKSLQPWKVIKIPKFNNLKMEDKKSQEEAHNLLDNLDWKSKPSFDSKKGH